MHDVQEHVLGGGELMNTTVIPTPDTLKEFGAARGWQVLAESSHEHGYFHATLWKQGTSVIRFGRNLDEVVKNAIEAAVLYDDGTP